LAILSASRLGVRGAEGESGTLPPAATRAVDYTKDIQPLLSERCYGCHGPDRQEKDLRWDVKSSALRGGASGPALIPGKSAESRVIRLVAGLEKGLVMPKKGPRLTPLEIGLLRAWIDQGAAWPDELAKTAPPDIWERTNWWSFRPARRPAVPKVANPQWSIRNPIDNFILTRLAESKLAPSPEAERRILIRRLSFDLTGLPPTPDEVDQFTADPAPDAYERLVDRLLASPRYGERWARHWLDLVHFGETHGYDKDKLRPNAWPYRDYVIRAFNENKPYPRFVQEQLAGDVLFPDEPEAVKALGFIAAGPWDFVGHAELPITKTDGLIARYNDRDDMVMTTISTFQSLTVHCARCHNHKFDPITQQDYYSLQAVFAGVDRANRPCDSDREVFRKRRALLAEKSLVTARRDELEQTKAKVSSPELVRLDARLVELKDQLGPDAPDGEKKSPSNGYHSNIESARDTEKWVQVDFSRPVTLKQIRLVPARPTDFADTPGFGFPVRFKVEISDEAAFAHAELVADHTSADFTNPGDSPVAIELPDKAVRSIRVTATRLWERTKDYVFALAELQAFANGTNVAREATVQALDSIESGRWARKNLVDGYSSRARLSDALPTPAEEARRARLEADAKDLKEERARVFDSLLNPSLKSELAEAEKRLGELERELGGLPAPEMVYAAAHDFKAEGTFVPAHGVRSVYLLARGDVKRPGELMVPAALAAVLGPEWRCEPVDPNDEGARRAALARWITDPRNMLTRRSIVNRVWQYHFGKGLVETPNDFGHMGALPSHPELLDWLAFWFLDHGESLKQLHKLIVTSATYRQVSAGRAEAAKIDGDNRYLWRMNRARLEAECIRDTMLFVSGRLDLRMGGPSDRQFFFKDDHSPVYDYTRFDVDSPEACRRSIYRHTVRSVPDPFMDCLDAADPSQLVARRYTTLTALQALATLNNPFVLRQCEHFAERLGRCSSDLGIQIELACRWALARKPTTAEAREFGTYVQRHGMANFCRVLFNTTEFVFVD
jgi:hypothetical protein